MKNPTASTYDALAKALDDLAALYDRLPIDQLQWINCPEHGAFLCSREALAAHDGDNSFEGHWELSRIACRRSADAEVLSELLNSVPRVYADIADKLPQAADTIRALASERSALQGENAELRRRLSQFESSVRTMLTALQINP